MFMHTHTPEAPWYTVEADDKRRARLNCIAHVVDSIDYSDMLPRPLKLGRRPHRVEYRRPPRGQNTVILTKH